MTAPVSALAQDIRIAHALLDISHAVGSVMEFDRILDTICGITARVMDTQTCSVYLLDEEKPDFLVLRATHGLSRAEELGVRGFDLGDGVTGWAASHNQTVALADARHDERYARLDDTQEETRLMAYLCTPLRIQEEVVGVLSVRRERCVEWSQEEIVFAEIIAKQVAIVLEKARLYVEKMEAERLAAIGISLSEVAHYIKNVLQTMTGGEYFVESGLRNGDVSKTERGWQLLKRSNGKIRALVLNMLNYSRGTQVELERGDLNALIANLAREVEENTMQRGVRLGVAIDELIPSIMFDEQALYDALLNLVTNALDALPAGHPDPEVKIVSRLDLSAGCARIQVSDNGSGIPEEVQAKMFNLFYSTKGHGGTGIGLAVTKKIVDEHGGRIFFETQKDVGTTFTIELPIKH
ncbi:GAF domain-containing protein [bacterium]|nr:GAF domain-containing protein [bacterium]